MTRNESPSRTVGAAGGSELGVSDKWLTVPIVESRAACGCSTKFRDSSEPRHATLTVFVR